MSKVEIPARFDGVPEKDDCIQLEQLNQYGEDEFGDLISEGVTRVTPVKKEEPSEQGLEDEGQNRQVSSQTKERGVLIQLEEVEKQKPQSNVRQTQDWLEPGTQNHNRGRKHST